MIDPAQIPDEVVEAAARAACATVERENSDVQAVKALGFGSVEEFIERAWPNYANQTRAAIAAALAAWPGAIDCGDNWIELPLPQQKGPA